MAHYTGPKARINRRLGAIIFESTGAVKASQRRDSPPGMQPPRRTLSKFGQSMREKQKIKFYYGLGERQLRRMFDHAQRMDGNTGGNLLLLCERRLDNVVRLAGLSKTRPQARQGVGHGHFLLNGRRIDKASTLVRIGDVIHVKRRPNVVDLYRGIEATVAVDWLACDAEKLEITILRFPTADDVTLPVDVGKVVELLSR